MKGGMDWIRKHYSVPAKRGGRIEYTGQCRSQFGTITGMRGGRLVIRIDGDEHTGLYHPTWRIRYLAAEIKANDDGSG